MNPLNTHVGAHYKADNQALAPASNAAGTRNGAALDVSKFQSGTLVANIGAASGTPTSFTITYALETSENGTTGWTALKDADGAAVTLAITTPSNAKEKDFSLQYATAGHPFLRVVETVAFVAGTTPTIVSGAVLVLGGSQRLPI